MAKAARSDTGITSASKMHLPSVTMNMIIDFLAEEETLYQPQVKRRVFHWFATVSSEGITCDIPAEVADAHLLFICRENEVERLLEEKPAAFALVLDKKSTPQAQDAIKRFPNRLMVIRQHDRFSFFIFRVQSYFTQLLMWEGELERIATRHGTLNDMLNAGATVMQNFTFISDINFNVIAHTTAIDPPDNLHSRIISTGCLTPQMIEEKRRRLPEREYYVKPASSLTHYPRLSRPLFANHTYIGSLSMSCHGTPLTEGLKDLLEILTRYVMPLCKSQWHTQVECNMPGYFFFTRMLQHKDVTDEYLHAQMNLAGIDESTEYKLIVMDVDEEIDSERAAAVTQSVSCINKGNVSCFPWKGEMLALCHTPPSDNQLSHLKTIKDLKERVYEPFGIDSGVSEVFVDITNLDLAYQQAKVALEFRHVIDFEQSATDQGGCKGVYLFGEALMYFLVDPGEKNPRFMRFCFQHSVLTAIYEEDQQNGTNCIALFWFYLYYGRNATATAQRLHMHRNTVLYHIDKIQKKFDIDLSWRTTRDRMMLDFKVFFITMGHESIEKLFSDTQDGLTEEQHHPDTTLS